MIDFFEYIEKAEQANANINKLISEASKFFLQNRIKKCSSIIEKSLLESEAQLLDLREIYFSFYTPKSTEGRNFIHTAAVGLNISIEPLSGFNAYIITLPFLLPNQRSHWQGFKDTIGTVLHYTLNEFCSSHKITPLNDCVIILTSFINSKTTLYTSDNDNKESKDIINILSKHLIRDDNGLICEIMYRTKQTSKASRTEIIITEKKDFLTVYSQF